MANAAIELRNRPEAEPRWSTSRSNQSGTNGVLAAVLLVIVLLSPIPLASNRPFFWAAVPALLLGLGALYMLVLAARDQRLRFAVSNIGWATVLYVLLGLYLVIQILPLGSFIGLDFADQFGAVFQSRTLSLTPGNTWLALLQWLGYGTFFFLMLQVAVNRGRAQRLLFWLFFAIAAYAAYGLVSLTQLGDTILGMDKWAYLGSATSTFVNRNSFATFLSFGLATGTALLFQSLAGSDEDGSPVPLRSRLPRVIAIFCALAFIVAALIATQSRMGFVSGAAGAAVVTLLAAARAALGGRIWRWLFILAAIGLVALFVLYGPALADRLFSIGDDIEGRSALYAEVWDMILARPLLGYGAGSFEMAFPLFQHAPLTPDLTWDNAHSTYLTYWADLGLVAGTVPALIALLLTLKALVGVWRGRRWSVPVAAVGVAVVAATHSTVDFSLEIQANVLMFLAILALGAAGLRPAAAKAFED